MPSIAIIGAGVSGLGAAHKLRDKGYRVTIFEKSDKAGGRATTNTCNGYIYDDGAQYIKEGPPEAMALITERFATPDLINIQKPIWIFDRQNTILEGDPTQNSERKISYRQGLISLGKRMAEELDIRYTTRITHLEQGTAGDHQEIWQLFDITGHAYGSYDALLITIPASQAGDLIDTSDLIDRSVQGQIVKQLRKATYNSLISVALGYYPRPQTRPYYALVNTDKQHTISWLAWEHEKCLERVPDGAGMLIAQMAPQYSREHMRTYDQELINDVARKVALLIDEQLPPPIFAAVQRWRFALPATRVDADELNTLTLPYSLAFCGDGFKGGRICLALEHGTIVARQFLEAQN